MKEEKIIKDIITQYTYEKYGKRYLGKKGEDVRFEGLVLSLEKALKDQREATIKEVGEGIVVPILMWTEKNNEWKLNAEIKKKLAELEETKPSKT